MTGGWGTPSWMGGDPDLGETFVQGRDPKTAQALLAAADELGLEALVVRAVTHGFIVPNAVYDHVQAQHQADPGQDF